jgi:hypothetical protein
LAVSIFEDFQEVVTGLIVQRGEVPVTQDQDLDGAQRLETAAGAAFAMGEREFVEQLGDAHRENRVVIPTSSVAKGASQPGFARARRPCDGQVLVGCDPVALEQLVHEPPVEPAG